ncbi:TonB-dependent receptor [Flavobacterium psychrotolerans]|uniref:TonB-dependent receptor n=1 Tax=Flavobacterium psychrotolerans TaxID=2169410 RepID=A0A2U1JPU5_9FLAO|nr:TonB-dependent receptor [Flavobacterium psychrotolerans]PWA07197.1 TonB-dependent receptor [Flavobacterium psychrotolerans]
MKIKIEYTTAVLLFLASFQTVLAQKKDENIGTEVVNVVKPYTPTISDAFKVKETPNLEDEDNTKKENIKYSIFSFPVASTFAPSKGKAAGVDKAAEETLYKNYFTGGLGNYLTAFAELYITENIGDNDYISAMVKHLSSRGGISGVPVKDNYLNTGIDLTYGSKKSDYSWNTDLGYQIQKYHWYGLPSDYGSLLTPEVRTTIYDGIDKGQTYNDFYLGGKVNFSESVFKEIALKYDRFWDGYSSVENRVIAKPSFQFDVEEETIKTNLIVDYVGGTFAKDLSGSTPADYGYVNFGIHPSFMMKKDDWSVNFGASVFYSSDLKHSNSQLFFYPKINASLKVVGDLMVFYAGAEGGLDQNSYRDFANENPFLSPNIFVTPTDRQYDLFAGLKGKLSNYISYNVKGSYVSEKNKGLFLSNPYSDTILVQDEYRYGNSFGVVYDDIKTANLFGELKGDFSKNVSFGINGTFSSFSTANLQEAWNLPTIKLGANLQVNFTDEWYAGTDLFFVGERKDQQVNLSIMPLIASDNTKTLDSYFDANAHLGYKYNKRFTAFLRFNNIANQAYQKWLNTPVQSFQVMLGGNYKFDF